MVVLANLLNAVATVLLWSLRHRLVLIVLTVFGKLFGVWGFLLGIPLVNYVFRHAIRFPHDQPQDVV